MKPEKQASPNSVHIFIIQYFISGDSVVRESTCNAEDARDMGLIPGSGRSPKVGNGNPLPGESIRQRSLWAAAHGLQRIGHD